MRTSVSGSGSSANEGEMLGKDWIGRLRGWKATRVEGYESENGCFMQTAASVARAREDRQGRCSGVTSAYRDVGERMVGLERAVNRSRFSSNSALGLK